MAFHSSAWHARAFFGVDVAWESGGALARKRNVCQGQAFAGTALCHKLACIYHIQAIPARFTRIEASMILQAFDHYGTAWLCYVGVSMFAWVASAIFHSRDTDVTEKLDYMAAFATVVTGFALSVIRCFGLSKYGAIFPIIS